jgi:hypothetical protein
MCMRADCGAVRALVGDGSALPFPPLDGGAGPSHPAGRFHSCYRLAGAGPAVSDGRFRVIFDRSALAVTALMESTAYGRRLSLRLPLREGGRGC